MQTESEGLELIIILALVAGFILFQLRRTLGKKTGYDPSEDEEGNPYQPSPKARDKGRDQENREDNVVPMRPDRDAARPAANLGLSKSSPFYSIVEKIHRLDPSFTLRNFFDGAEYAYGLILNAFWDGDRKTLRSMLSREVYDQFDGAIAKMEKRKLTPQNKLMDIEKIDLVDATISGSLAEVTVEFTSHMVMSTRDAEGVVVDGDGDKPVKVTDVWTFCRDVKSADPNWTLVATRTA